MPNLFGKIALATGSAIIAGGLLVIAYLAAGTFILAGFLSAVINFVIIEPCLLLGFAFPVLWLVPSAHAVIAIYMSREDRKHREIVDAIERHGPPPGWRG